MTINEVIHANFPESKVWAPTRPDSLIRHAKAQPEFQQMVAEAILLQQKELIAQDQNDALRLFAMLGDKDSDFVFMNRVMAILKRDPDFRESMALFIKFPDVFHGMLAPLNRLIP